MLHYYSNLFRQKGPSWSYDSWIYNYLCNQYLSPLTLWVRIPLRRGVLDTTLCDKVCQWLATGRWFSPGTPVFSTSKTDHHHITEILLKVASSTIKPKPIFRPPKKCDNKGAIMQKYHYFKCWYDGVASNEIRDYYDYNKRHKRLI